LSPVSASDPTEVIGVLGRSVTFQSRNTDGNPAFWNFGNDPIVTVAFEDPPQPLFSEEKFETRFAVSEKGRALTISQLRMEDAGTYSVKISGKTSTFTLQVFRELAEPTVTCEAQNCSDGSCSSSLRCSAPGAGFGNVSYTWRQRDQTWDGSSVVLLVNKTSQDELGPLMCTARNPVSNRSVTVTTPGELCAGRVGWGAIPTSKGLWGRGFTQAWTPGVGIPAFPGQEHPGRIPKSPNSCFFPPDPGADSATVYAEVGPSQQRVPDRTEAKPAEGAPPSTIYSLVKRPDQVDGGRAENATTAGLELV
ncbi:SLAF9 protein, partial [Calcarius ornatus]|nr:SLAF9 protein [Calcarius ornatus]